MNRTVDEGRRDAGSKASSAKINACPTIRHSLTWLGTVAGLAAFIWILNHQLVSGQTFPRWDADGQFVPWYILLADHARALRFLLWDPWTEAGVPLGVEPQVGAFSPLAVGMGFLTGGTEQGYVAYWLVVWSLAGIGMIFLARHLGAPAWGAFAVGLGWALSGMFTGHASHFSGFHAYAWLPWIVWRLDTALVDRSYRAALQAGALFGLSALAGYPGVVFANAIFLGLWSLGRSFDVDGLDLPGLAQSEPPARRFLRAAGALVLLGLVALVVLSPTYLAFLTESQDFSDRRNPLTRDLALSSNPWTLSGVSTLAGPHVLLMNRGSWGSTDITSVSIYAGGLSLWLAILALAGRRRARLRAWMAGLGCLGLALAASQELPLRGWLYDLLPPSRYFRHSSIFRGWFILVCCVLAALGARDLERMRHAPAVRPGLSYFGWALGLALGSAAVYVWSARTMAEIDSYPVSPAQFAIVWVGMIAVGILVSFASRRVLASACIPALVVLTACVDAAITYRTSALTIYYDSDSVRNSWLSLKRLIRSDLDLKEFMGINRPNAEVRRMDNKHLVAKVPVLDGYLALSSARYSRLLESEVLKRAATGSDRLWFAPEAVRVSDSDEAFSAFISRAEYLGTPPLVIVDSDGEGVVPPQAIASAPPARHISVELTEYEPNRLAFVVRCFSSGHMVVTDRWARGWSATVNGRAVPIERGMFLFRAIPLPAGPSKVCFEYRAFGHPWLVLLSWSCMAMIAIFSIQPKRVSSIVRHIRSLIGPAPRPRNVRTPGPDLL